MNKIYFIIGASGAGKTTSTRALEQKRPDMQFCYPDKGEVIPSEKEMEEKFGSSSNWQKIKTIEWVKNVKEKYLSDKSVLVDTQTRYDFIEIACKENSIENFQVILFDCEDSVRNQRIHSRGQSYLANTKMDDWARFLREDAKKHNCIIVDTSDIKKEDMADPLEKIIQ